MVVEVDALTRCNNWTNRWRLEDAATSLPTEITAPVFYSVGLSNQPVTVVGPPSAPRSTLATLTDTTRTAWITSAGASTIPAALSYAGIPSNITFSIEDDDIWRQTLPSELLSTTEALERFRAVHPAPSVDWLIAVEPRDVTTSHQENLHDLLYAAVH